MYTSATGGFLNTPVTPRIRLKLSSKYRLCLSLPRPVSPATSLTLLSGWAEKMEKRSAREDGAYQVDGVTSSHDGPRYGATHEDLGLLQAFPVLGHSFFCTSCTPITGRGFLICVLIYETLARTLYTSISTTPFSFSALNDVIASRIGLYPGHSTQKQQWRQLMAR